MQRDAGCGRHSSSGTRPANTVAGQYRVTDSCCRPPPYPPSGVTCCAGAKSPVHSSPSHQRISEGSPDGSGYQPGGMFMIAPVRLGPLRSGSCRSPVSRPRLAYSARHLHRPRITAPRHRRRDTGKPAPIVQPRPRATHIMRHHRAACSVSLPDPPTPKCRLSRGFCTALRVFKRV